jgi:vitamin B12 transporter
MRALIIIAGFTSLPLYLWAAEPQKMALVKVTATAIPKPLTNPSEMISLQKANTRNLDFVRQALQTQKSIQLSDQGNPGKISSATVRGTKAAHATIIIDGLQVDNPLDYGSFDFANVLADDIESVSVAANPHPLNQTHASGGAIILTTKKGQGKPALKGRIEQGSHPHRKLNIQGAGSDERGDFFISATHYKSGRGERGTLHHTRVADAYDTKNLTSNIGLKLNSVLELRTLVQMQASSLKLDAPVRSMPWASNNEQNTQKNNFMVRLNHKIQDKFQQYLILGHTETRLTYLTQNIQTNSGDVNTLRYGWQWQAFEKLKLNMSAENRQEKFKPANAFVRTIENKFLNASFIYTPIKPLEIQASSRYHYLALGKQHYTYQLGARYKLLEEFTLKAGYGTGVRPPRMQEFYGDRWTQPNPTLKPERSKNFETGFEIDLLQNKLFIDVTYFNNQINNFITYQQIQNAIYRNFNTTRHTRGLELYTKYKASKSLSLDLTYTYIDASDSEIRGYPIRLARHKLSLDAVWQIQPKFDIYSGIFFKSARRDTAGYPVSYVRLSSYATVHAGANYRLNEQLEIYGRIDNLFNRKYEDVYGYGATGTQGLIGLRGTF